MVIYMRHILLVIFIIMAREFKKILYRLIFGMAWPQTKGVNMLKIAETRLQKKSVRSIFDPWLKYSTRNMLTDKPQRFALNYMNLR